MLKLVQSYNKYFFSKFILETDDILDFITRTLIYLEFYFYDHMNI